MNNTSSEITNDQLIASIITALTEHTATKAAPECIKSIPVDAVRDNLTAEIDFVPVDKEFDVRKILDKTKEYLDTKREQEKQQIDEIKKRQKELQVLRYDSDIDIENLITFMVEVLKRIKSKVKFSKGTKNEESSVPNYDGGVPLNYAGGVPFNTVCDKNLCYVKWDNAYNQ